MEKLTDEAIASALASMPGWRRDGDCLRQDFVFDGFTEAFGFMTSIAIEAARADHHPEWSNVYNRVSIALTTHDAGGITRADIDLARIIDALAAPSSRHRAR